MGGVVALVEREIGVLVLADGVLLCLDERGMIDGGWGTNPGGNATLLGRAALPKGGKVAGLDS